MAERTITTPRYTVHEHTNRDGSRRFEVWDRHERLPRWSYTTQDAAARDVDERNAAEDAEHGVAQTLTPASATGSTTGSLTPAPDDATGDRYAVQVHLDRDQRKQFAVFDLRFNSVERLFKTRTRAERFAAQCNATERSCTTSGAEIVVPAADAHARRQQLHDAAAAQAGVDAALPTTHAEMLRATIRDRVDALTRAADARHDARTLLAQLHDASAALGRVEVTRAGTQHQQVGPACARAWGALYDAKQVVSAALAQTNAAHDAAQHALHAILQPPSAAASTREAHTAAFEQQALARATHEHTERTLQAPDGYAVCSLCLRFHTGNDALFCDDCAAEVDAANASR